MKFLLCTMLLAILGQGILGQRGGGGGNDRDRSSPNENACNFANLRSLSEDARNLFLAVVAGTSEPIELLPYLSELPSVCLRRIRSFFEDAPGTCTSEGVITELCNLCNSEADDGESESETETESRRRPCLENNARELLRTAMACLNQENICQFVQDVLENNQDCIPVELNGYLAELSDENECQIQLPVCAILSLPLDELSTRLEDMDAAGLLSFLEGVDLEFVHTLPCEKTRLIARIVMDKNLIDPTQVPVDLLTSSITKLLPLMPYLPRATCESFTISVLQSLLQLPGFSEVDFMCDKSGGMGGMDDNDMDMDMPDMEMSEGQGTESPDTDDMENGLCGLGKKDMPFLRGIRRHNSRNPSCNLQCGRVLADTLAEEMEDLSLGTLEQCLPISRLRDLVSPGNCPDGLNRRRLTLGQRRQIAKPCAPNDNFTTWEDDDVISMGCFFLDLGPRALMVPDEALCGSLTAENGLSSCLKNQRSASPSMVRAITRRCLGNGITGDIIRNIGEAIVQAPCDDLETVDSNDRMEGASVLASGIADMVANRQRGRKLKASCVKLSDLPAPVIAGSRDVARNINLRSLQRKFGNSGSSIREALGDTIPDFTMTQNRRLARILRGSKNCENLTLEDASEMSSMVRGLSRRCIRKFRREERLDMLLDICQWPEWSEEQSEAIGDTMVEALTDLNTVDAMSELTSDMVEGMDTSCLTGLSDVLLNMSSEVCVAVCRRLGAAVRLQCSLSEDTRQMVAESCLMCLGTEESGVTEEDVVALGQLVPDVPANVLPNLPGAGLRRIGRSISAFRCIKKDVIDSVQDKINAVVGDDEDVDSLRELGLWALGLDSAKLEAVKSQLVDALDSITEALQYSEEGSLRSCCERYLSDEDKDAIQQEMERRLEVLRELATTDTMTTDEGATPTRRKRQAETPLTCQNLLSMDLAVTGISVDQINALTSEDFENCVPDLGNQDGWTQQQLNALIGKYQEFVQSDLCVLTSDQLQDLGNIARAMTVENIECLENLDLDAVSNLGELWYWTDEQKAAFAARFIQLHNKVSPSSLIGSDVIALGHFLCGLSTEEIGQIPADSYGEASVAVGELQMCEQEKLAALAGLAKHVDNFGPVADWEAEHYEEAGIVVAGLTGEEIQSASLEDIEGWTETAIMHMKLDVVAGLSVEQLSSFSMSQANAVDETNPNFSLEQTNTILVAQGNDPLPPTTTPTTTPPTGDGGDSNGAVTTRVSAALILGFLCFVIF